MNRSALQRGLIVAAFITATALWLVASTAAAQAVPSHEVLDVDEAAVLLRVQPEVIRALAETQRIPARRIGDLWRFSRAALLEWLKGDQSAGTASRSAMEPGRLDRAERLARERLTLTARGVAPQSPTRLSQAEPTAKPQPDSAPPPAVGEPPATPSAEEIALRDQSVLLRRGAATVDFGVLYERSEQTLFPVIRVEQNTVGLSGALRYGLLDDLQVTLRVPALWRRSATFSDATIAGTNSRRITRDSYLGDASLSLLGVAWREAVARPTVIWSLDGVVPTGPGDGGVGGGFVLSKSYDPAVLFAGVSYLYGLSVDPTDSRRSLAQHNVGFHLGYTYAVNDTLALSTVFLGTYRNASSPDGVAIPPPHERYRLQLGMTWLLARNLFIEPAVAIRLGGDSPDLAFALNFSHAFWQ